MTEEASDDDLMRAYLGGDERAFEALYRRHSAKVYGYLRRKLPDRASADEVFQSVFLKLHRTRRNWNPAYPFAQWLFVVARTTLLDHFRKAGREVPLSGEPLDEDRVSQSPPAPSLNGEKEWEALSRLPPEQRQAIEMRVIDERSYEEIAAALGRTPSGVRQLVSRGLRKLRLGGIMSLRRDFELFRAAEPVTPPGALAATVRAAVHADLNPGAWGVFLKLAAIHSVVGTLTLLICPQFGVNLLGGMGLMALFMRFGETVCMIACGIVFTGGSLGVASLALRPEEVRAVRGKKALQIPLLALASIGAFICIDPSIIGGLSLFWILGSVAGGIGTLELGWALRRRLFYGSRA